MPEISQECKSSPTRTDIVVQESERFQVAQALYAAVTGKTEKLSKSYAKRYVVNLLDLKQLNAKCNQACTQWKVLQRSTSVTVHHVDDNKEQFSSFERFNIYDVSKTAAVESVVYEFSILVALPGVERPQNYKATVRVLSRLAAAKKATDEEPWVPRGFFRWFGMPTIFVEIEYVDYVVARNLLSMIDSWASQVEQATGWAWAESVQKRSHWIAPLSELGITVMMAIGLVKATSVALGSGGLPEDWVKWGIVCATALIISRSVARWVGGAVEESIDSVLQLSTIKFNKGDERLVEQYGRRNLWRSIGAGLGIAFVIGQGIVANFLTYLIAGFFKP
jgi:hypothetical protein